MTQTLGIRRSLQRAWRYVAAAHIDLRLALTGKADPDLPPLRLLVGGIGAGDFRAIGEELAALVIKYGAIARDSDVLDVGCGVGRVAIPLTRYLNDAGRYEGFDVGRGAIRWCRRAITRRHRNFRFTHVSVRSSMYSAFGNDASSFAFPYPSETFDCAFAFSLFTHLTLTEIRRYLAECARVLGPGGRLIATFFIVDDELEARLPTLEPALQFPVSEGPIRLASRHDPASAVAIRADVLLQLLSEAGFSETRVFHGKWPGRSDGATFQDLIVCRK